MKTFTKFTHFAHKGIIIVSKSTYNYLASYMSFENNIHQPQHKTFAIYFLKLQCRMEIAPEGKYGAEIYRIHCQLMLAASTALLAVLLKDPESESTSTLMDKQRWPFTESKQLMVGYQGRTTSKTPLIAEYSKKFLLEKQMHVRYSTGPIAVQDAYQLTLTWELIWFWDSLRPVTSTQL